MRDQRIILWAINKVAQLTWIGSGSRKSKNPATPDDKKLVAKLVTVACRDDRALRLLT